MEQGIEKNYGIFSDLEEAIITLCVEAQQFFKNSMIQPDADEIYKAYHQPIIDDIDENGIFKELDGLVTVGDFCDEFIIKCIR